MSSSVRFWGLGRSDGCHFRLPRKGDWDFYLKIEKVYVIRNITKLITKANKHNNKKQQKRKCENMGTTMII